VHSDRALLGFIVDHVRQVEIVGEATLHVVGLRLIISETNAIRAHCCDDAPIEDDVDGVRRGIRIEVEKNHDTSSMERRIHIEMASRINSSSGP